MKLHDYIQHAIQIYKRHLNIWYKCVGGSGGSYLMTLVGEILINYGGWGEIFGPHLINVDLI